MDEIREHLNLDEFDFILNFLKSELINLMEKEAGKFNQETLPMRDE